MSLADLYSALADPTRLRVLEMLHDKARPVHELAGAFDISRPAISRHLRVLKEAGLVKEVKRGRENLYSFQREELKAGVVWLQSHQGRGPAKGKSKAAAKPVEATLPLVAVESVVVPAPVVEAKPVAKPKPATKPKVATRTLEPMAPPPSKPAPQLSLFDF
jgi:DNA-binding transcriptional ArsR family regulator